MENDVFFKMVFGSVDDFCWEKAAKKTASEK